MKKSYVLKPSLTLFITAVITIAALSAVYTLTAEPIEAQKQKVRVAAMKEVLPEASEFTELSDASAKSGSITAVYEGRIADNRAAGSNAAGSSIAGYVVQLSPEGYSGAIDLIVGISVPGNKITGMRVLGHTETPGLGALAVKGNFYKQFDNRDLVPLNVVRTPAGADSIQAITSATITSKAITGAVNEAINWYNREVKK
ncbi:MAG: RnfABCDGE type electron transport complex subunit G [Treponema sp.]|nr:RnfABCDGE type electron transport complex subunit G [Treponema sp.]